MNFKKYMRQFISENSARGDLANDIGRDESFPNGSLKKMLSHLKSLNACDGAIKALTDCYKDFGR